MPNYYLRYLLFIFILVYMVLCALALIASICAYQLPETLGVTLPSSSSELLKNIPRSADDRQPLLEEDA
jgi:hypothetical protein